MVHSESAQETNGKKVVVLLIWRNESSSYGRAFLIWAVFFSEVSMLWLFEWKLFLSELLCSSRLNINTDLTHIIS